MPPRKRARVAAAAAAPTAAAAQEQPENNSADQERRDEQRKNTMAQVARSRAAHFANFRDEEENLESNVHVGSDEARNLGPWSSAYELVNEREQAANARGDKVARLKQQVAEQEALVDWKPSRDPAQGPRSAARVSSLLDMCVDLVVKHIDAVESLLGLPDGIKVKLAQAVCAKRKMSPEVARLFTEGMWGEVEVQDCTQLDAAAMQALLRASVTSQIERLELGSCGRGFGDEAAALLAKAGPLNKLRTLRLQGAYRLSDTGLLVALEAASQLTHLAVPQAIRVTGAALMKLPQLVPALTHLDLADCRAVDASALEATLVHLPALRSITLQGIFEVNDAVLQRLGKVPTLRHVSVGACKALTDTGVSSLVSGRPELESLVLDECHLLSDASLLRLAASCKNLSTLSIRRCTKLTDAGLSAVASNGTLRALYASGVPALGPATLSALSKHCHNTLQAVDVSFCREVPAKAFGLLADSCNALRELRVFGCTQLTREVVHGHSNEELQMLGLPTLTAEA